MFLERKDKRLPFSVCPPSFAPSCPSCCAVKRGSFLCSSLQKPSQDGHHSPSSRRLPLRSALHQACSPSISLSWVRGQSPWEVCSTALGFPACCSLSMLRASPGPQKAPLPAPLSSFYWDQGLEADLGAEPAVGLWEPESVGASYINWSKALAGNQLLILKFPLVLFFSFIILCLWVPDPLLPFWSCFSNNRREKVDTKP